MDVKCIDCSEKFSDSRGLKKRCPDCWKKYRLEYMRNWRKGRKG